MLYLVAKITLLFASRCFFIIYFYICGIYKKVNKNSMQALLTNIELDIQELKYLMDAFSREPNAALREVLKRSILQMRARLDQLLLDLDAAQIPLEEGEQKPLTEKIQKPLEERVQKPLTEKIQIPLEDGKQKPLTEKIQKPLEEGVQTPMTEKIQTPLDEKLQKLSVSSTPILGERIRPAMDLRRSISLNDSFRFSRELFKGDNEQMNRVIEQISEMNSLETAVAFLVSKVDVDKENEAMADFMEILKKFFN